MPPCVCSCRLSVFGLYLVPHSDVEQDELVPRYQFTMWPHILVSYAAGSLWPLNAMMMSWSGFVATPAQSASNRVKNDSFCFVILPNPGRHLGALAKLRTMTSSAFGMADSVRSAQLYTQCSFLETGVENSRRPSF